MDSCGLGLELGLVFFVVFLELSDAFWFRVGVVGWKVESDLGESEEGIRNRIRCLIGWEGEWYRGRIR